MNSILIKNVLLNGNIQDILIENNIISRIGKNIIATPQRIIDGKNKAAIPGLINGHTHATMTLMRGFADDIQLKPWLETKIWPLEAKLTPEDVYWGSKLACLEMIKTGTTTMIDMYFFVESTMRAVEEMGIRSLVGTAGFDFGLSEKFEKYKQDIAIQQKIASKYSDRIKFTMVPHAIYTVSTKMLKWVREYANDNNLRIHIHLSETQNEVNDAIRDFGMRPVRYLDSIGFLGPDVSLAHCLHLDDEEIKILADNGSQVIHAPVSNMKLASGLHFRHRELKDANVTVCLGTDGACSNNCLDMFDTMKMAALMGKMSTLDSCEWSAEETFNAATQVAEELTGFKTGILKEGYLADIVLIDLLRPEMTPCFNLTSNIVYAASGSIVDTVICDGKIIMENRIVPGEAEILENASRIAYDLVSRI